jgi:hypothetical protein
VRDGPQAHDSHDPNCINVEIVDGDCGRTTPNIGAAEHFPLELQVFSWVCAYHRVDV